jgi:hypothetical protein
MNKYLDNFYPGATEIVSDVLENIINKASNDLMDNLVKHLIPGKAAL